MNTFFMALRITLSASLALSLYAVDSVKLAFAESTPAMVQNRPIAPPKPFLLSQEQKDLQAASQGKMTNNNVQNIGKPSSAPPTGLGQQVQVIKTPIGMPPPLPTNTQRQAGVVRVVKELKSMQLAAPEVASIKNIQLNHMRAASTPYIKSPRAGTRTLMLDLSPGVAPPTIYLANGQLSSLVFSDMGGNPWMIERVALNRSLFNDAAKSDRDTNVLSLESLQPVAQGNISIMLRGLSTPVIFSLISDENPTMDARVDVKVPGRNPDYAMQTVQTDNAPTIDHGLSYFLDGVPPKEARKLKSSSTQVEAWVLDQQLYIRTQADLQYPAYFASARSTSGMAVYRFNQIYKMVTLLSQGRAQTIFFE